MAARPTGACERPPAPSATSWSAPCGRSTGSSRRRLGASFLAADLAALYGEDLGWAEDAARRASQVADLTTSVDCAFARYARMAADWAGGRTHEREDESFSS